MKKNSDAKIKANNKYTAAHYDRINMALPKGSRRLVEYCAKKHGESVNRYVCRVVLERIWQNARKSSKNQGILIRLRTLTVCGGVCYYYFKSVEIYTNL